jgi:DNA-binding transcriptional ArsR family regulator
VTRYQEHITSVSGPSSRFVSESGPATSPEAALAALLAAWDRCLDAVSRDRDLGLEATRVMLQLRLHVNRKSGLAWPSHQTLAELLGMARPNVTRAIRVLRERGYITTEQRSFNGHTHTVYRPGPHVSREIPGPTPIRGTQVSPEILPHVSPEIRPGISGDTQTPEGTPEENPETGVPRSEPAFRVRAREAPPAPSYLPDDWEPSERAVTNACAEFQLTPDQVAHETRRFASKQRGQGVRAVSWLDEWWRWLDNVRPGSRLRDRLLGTPSGGGRLWGERTYRTENADPSAWGSWS